jgi:hypothetical protein
MNPVAPFPDLVRSSVPTTSSIEVDRRGGVTVAGVRPNQDWTDPASSWTIGPRWTIPDVVDRSGDHGLSDVAVETLSRCLRPVLDGLGELDAELLLELKRLDRPGGEGPCVRDG